MLNQVSTTIIGVLPPDFRLFRDPNVPTASRTPRIDFIAPLELGPTQLNSRAGGNTIVARLKRGVTVKQAQSDIEAVAAEMAVRDPVRHEGRTVRAEPFEEVVHRDYRSALVLLQGAVGFVLLISCANVAGLLLARNSSRRHEVHLRIALGAGRARIIRQLVAENLPLAIVGGAIGVSVSMAALSLFGTMAPAEFGLLDRVAVDLRVLFFTAAVVLATAALFAVLPAIQAVRTDRTDPMKEVSRTVTSSAHRQRLRGILVMAQIALALVLLIGAGLMINSFARVVTKNLGADPANLLSFSFQLPPAETIKVTGMYRGVGLAVVNPKPAMLVERVLEKLETIPGVAGVAGVNSPPFGFRPLSMPFLIEGKAKPIQPDTADYFGVTRGFFRLMKTPLVRGREFDEHDNENGKPVAIINETLARQFFPAEDPIGKHITLDFVPDERPREIVGVAGNTFTGPLQARHQPAIYLPHLQQTSQWIATSWVLRSGMYFVVRASGDPTHLIPAVKAAVAEVDPNTPAADIGTVEQTLDNQTRTLRLYMSLLGIFAAVAALMSATGIYGAVAYSVAARTREIGIRMALGGRAQVIVMLVLRQSAWMIVGGLGAGLVSALALSRLLQSLLFEITATDMATYVAISLLLLFISVIACVIPARRAAAIDPVQTLKVE
jgi:putative ABC transport system permease protein